MLHLRNAVLVGKHRSATRILRNSSVESAFRFITVRFRNFIKETLYGSIPNPLRVRFVLDKLFPR